MKKSAVATPNTLLKEARELRGWSQKDIAEKIGVDRYYLSRWERGTTAPSPYYRQKLCELFGKNARELGLIYKKTTKEAQASQSGHEGRQQGFLEKSPASSRLAAIEKSVESPLSRDVIAAVTHTSIFDPMLPSPLPRIAKPIGRDDVARQLRERLCAGNDVVLSALHGLPGVGKTTLAIELAHDEQVLAHFRDGVLWAGLGPTPDVFAILNHWGTLLGVSSQQAMKLKSIEDWSRTLRALIGQRQLLLVIDDAWRIEAALALKVGGPRCVYLLTTRFPTVALHFASSGEAIVLRELNEDDGLALLARLAPEVVKQEPESARTLVRAVGGLPLALTLMGRYLRTQTHSGQPRRIRAALERLRTAEERLRLTEPLPPLERPASLAPAVPLSLQTVLAVSDHQLEEQEQQALRALSVFPARPNSFSEEAALAVSGAPVEVIDALCDSGLLESSGPGQYTLHQVITDYARFHMDDPVPYLRLAAYYATFIKEHEREYDLLHLETNNIFAAFEAASSYQQHESLVRGVNALFSFLFTRGLYAQEAGIYIERAVQSARHLNNDALLVEALLHQGKAAYKQRTYDKAEQCLQEARERASNIHDPLLLSEVLMMIGVVARFRTSSEVAEQYLRDSLALVRQQGDSRLLSDVLANLGSVLSDKGDFAGAEAYNQEGLALARQRGDREQVVQILINLNSIAIFRGEYLHGENYGQEALALAHELGFLDAISAIYTNLGGAAIDHGEYEKAERYILQALDAARRVDDIKIMSADLASLGTIAVVQERFEQAEQYMVEATRLAQKVGDTWLTGAILLERGELYLKQRRFDEAFTVFDAASHVSAQVNSEVVASSLYGLARVAAARGDMIEAHRLGYESLRLFEAAGNRFKDNVKSWLVTLPGE